jgi:hypothetical protein
MAATRRWQTDDMAVQKLAARASTTASSIGAEWLTVQAGLQVVEAGMQQGYLGGEHREL